MTTHPTFGFVVEYVDDIEASTRFYTEVLGLKVERSHPTFVQFEKFAIAADEPMSGNGEAEVYWLVDDAEAAFAELSRKVEVSRPLEEMPFGKVFGVKDPDGNPRYILELAANRPSHEAQVPARPA
jgi:catechol 2,3-dioxygenase-like lactoylglutathione lyase family enzyme